MASESREQYDFIMVGAGASGCVLAAELSASGSQVLIVESGGPDNAPTIANPSIWFSMSADRSTATACKMGLPKVRDQEDGGSNPLAPTNSFNHLQGLVDEIAHRFAHPLRKVLP